MKVMKASDIRCCGTITSFRRNILQFGVKSLGSPLVVITPYNKDPPSRDITPLHSLQYILNPNNMLSYRGVPGEVGGGVQSMKNATNMYQRIMLKNA